MSRPLMRGTVPAWTSKLGTMTGYLRAVQGQPGTALVFEHGLIHEGGEVTEGVKYVLRSDVMYGRIGQLAG